MPRDEDHVTDILNAARTIERRLTGIDRASVEGNDVLQDAIIRQFEIIGEATKRISANFRDLNPQIPWRKMAGMRDVLVHAYDQVVAEEVWGAATRDLPELIRELEILRSDQ